MKETKRYISAAVGLVLLAVVLWLIDTILLPIVLSLIGIIAVYEATSVSFSKVYLRILLPQAAFVILRLIFPFGLEGDVTLLIFVLFCIGMISYGKLPLKDLTCSFFITTLVAYGLPAILKLRDLGITLSDKRILVIYGFGFGWLGDSMAYSIGKAFGKRKMSPNISPNKTIVGGVSGVLLTTLVSVILFIIYAANANSSSIFSGRDTPLNLCIMAAVGLVGSIIGVYGDLALSFVKRETNVKDFSNIMPGHGGALDRIDNILFTSVYAYFIFTLLLSAPP